MKRYILSDVDIIISLDFCSYHIHLSKIRHLKTLKIKIIKNLQGIIAPNHYIVLLWYCSHSDSLYCPWNTRQSTMRKHSMNLTIKVFFSYFFQ